MFRGEFESILDEKGRLSIPSKFRKVLSEKYSDDLILTKWGNFLVVYPLSEWTIIEEKILSQSPFNPQVQSLKRFLVSSATEVSVDKQGRILIPPSLRESAGLSKEIVMAGQLKQFEIWDKSEWKLELSKAKEGFPANSKLLSELGV